MKKGEIGRRIRAVRQEQKMSLRQVAATASLSATHISEIERGHTTPTVGALLRISDALQRETHFFLEAEWLPEVSVLRANETAPEIRVNGSRTIVERLTKGIPGSKLEFTRLTLGPKSQPTSAPKMCGERAGYVLSGRISLQVEGEDVVLESGDGFHLRSDLPHTMWNPGDVPATVLLTKTRGTNSLSS